MENWNPIMKYEYDTAIIFSKICVYGLTSTQSQPGLLSWTLIVWYQLDVKLIFE